VGCTASCWCLQFALWFGNDSSRCSHQPLPDSRGRGCSNQQAPWGYGAQCSLIGGGGDERSCLSIAMLKPMACGCQIVYFFCVSGFLLLTISLSVTALGIWDHIKSGQSLLPPVPKPMDAFPWSPCVCDKLVVDLS